MMGLLDDDGGVNIFFFSFKDSENAGLSVAIRAQLQLPNKCVLGLLLIYHNKSF
jgi:hypothetical protein